VGEAVANMQLNSMTSVVRPQLYTAKSTNNHSILLKATHKVNPLMWLKHHMDSLKLILNPDIIMAKNINSQVQLCINKDTKNRQE
jgi:hypothetical protein